MAKPKDRPCSLCAGPKERHDETCCHGERCPDGDPRKCIQTWRHPYRA